MFTTTVLNALNSLIHTRRNAFIQHYHMEVCFPLTFSSRAMPYCQDFRGKIISIKLNLSTFEFILSVSFYKKYCLEMFSLLNNLFYFMKYMSNLTFFFYIAHSFFSCVLFGLWLDYGWLIGLFHWRVKWIALCTSSCLKEYINILAVWLVAHCKILRLLAIK